MEEGHKILSFGAIAVASETTKFHGVDYPPQQAKKEVRHG